MSRVSKFMVYVHDRIDPQIRIQFNLIMKRSKIKALTPARLRQTWKLVIERFVQCRVAKDHRQL